jgi:aryl-alcohol dehydrogenase-like predicted oxidoreductase
MMGRRHALVELRWLTASGAGPGRFVFGGWQVGGARQGHIPNDVAEALIREALHRGVRAFDTANVYGNGRSEVLLGHALADVRADVFVISKAGYLTGMDGSQELFAIPPQSFRPDSLLRSLEESLLRLRSDYLDAFLLHDPPEEVVRSDAVWDMLRTARDDGLVRSIGASTSPRKAVLAIEHGAEVIEVLFSRARPEAREELLPMAGRRNVVVLARSPFCGGPLLSEVTPTGPGRTVGLRRLLEFPLEHPGVTGMVVGIASLAELVEDLNCLGGSVVDGR